MKQASISPLLVACVVGTVILSTCVGRMSCANEQVGADVLAAEQSRIEAIARAAATTIAVFSSSGGGGGSGVIISADGYALTNFHVVQPCGSFMKCGLPDGNLYDAVVVGIDPTGDVGLIKLVGRDDFPAATLGDSDRLRVGDWCFTAGNPFLLATDFQPSVAYGIVSGVHRYQYPAGTLLEYADCLQTDAAINPGNSGGPLFNAAGQLVGINGRGSFEKRGRVNVGVGYAISINQIKHFLGYLKSGRIVDHATLGATVATDDDGRVVVTNILGSSDAYRRGLRFNDEIISLGGRTIDSANAFKNVLGIYPRGWRIPLSFQHAGERQDVLVRLSGVHTQDELIRKTSGKVPKPPGDDPKPDRPREKDPQPDPEKPTPRQRLGRLLRRPAAPASVRKLFAARRGYANYYFNELNRDRIWQGFASGEKAAPSKAEWVIRGALERGGQVELILRDDEAFLTWPDGPVRLDLVADIDALVRKRVLPDGRIIESIGVDNGALLALSMWRRLVLDTPREFGDVFYLGTVPIANRTEQVDVLVAVRNVVENRCWFEPTDSKMLGLEAYYDLDSDPVEVYFHEGSTVGEKLLPGAMSVRLGDEIIELRELAWSGGAEDEI